MPVFASPWGQLRQPLRITPSQTQGGIQSVGKDPASRGLKNPVSTRRLPTLLNSGEPCQVPWAVDQAVEKQGG